VTIISLHHIIIVPLTSNGDDHITSYLYHFTKAHLVVICQTFPFPSISTCSASDWIRSHLPFSGSNFSASGWTRSPFPIDLQCKRLNKITFFRFTFSVSGWIKSSPSSWSTFSASGWTRSPFPIDLQCKRLNKIIFLLMDRPSVQAAEQDHLFPSSLGINLQYKWLNEIIFPS